MELVHFILIGLGYLFLIMWAAECGFKRAKNEMQLIIAYKNLLFVKWLNKLLRPIFYKVLLNQNIN